MRRRCDRPENNDQEKQTNPLDSQTNCTSAGAKRKASASPAEEFSQDTDEAKRSRLEAEELVDVGTPSTSSIVVDDIVVKQETNDAYLSTWNRRATMPPRITNVAPPVVLPKVKVLREIEDPTAMRGGVGVVGGGGFNAASRFTQFLSPEECIEPILEGMLTCF